MVRNPLLELLFPLMKQWNQPVYPLDYGSYEFQTGKWLRCTILYDRRGNNTGTGISRQSYLKSFRKELTKEFMVNRLDVPALSVPLCSAIIEFTGTNKQRAWAPLPIWCPLWWWGNWPLGNERSEVICGDQGV